MEGVVLRLRIPKFIALSKSGNSGFRIILIMSFDISQCVFDLSRALLFVSVSFSPLSFVSFW